MRMAHHGWPQATRERKTKIASEVGNFIDIMEQVWQDIEDWDGNKGSIHLCDELDDYLYDNQYLRGDEHRENLFATQVSCCVRAGFDVAVAPSAGVLGFNVGTLRRMYQGEIPAWVANWFTPPLTGEEKDRAGVWL